MVRKYCLMFLTWERINRRVINTCLQPMSNRFQHLDQIQYLDQIIYSNLFSKSRLTFRFSFRLTTFSSVEIPRCSYEKLRTSIWELSDICSSYQVLLYFSNLPPVLLSQLLSYHEIEKTIDMVIKFFTTRCLFAARYLID